MNRRTKEWLVVTLIAMAVVAFGVLSLTGCAGRGHSFRVAKATFNATESTLIDLGNAGYLDAEEVDAFTTWRTVGRAALETWGLALKNDDSAAEAVERFHEALQPLTDAMLSGEARKDADND